MKRYLLFLLTPILFIACTKNVQVPSTVTVDDISAILEAKDLDIDKLQAYLPVFVQQYASDVEAFLAYPTKDEAQRLEARNKTLGNVIATLQSIQGLMKGDFQVDLARHTKNLQRIQEDADAKIKEVLSGKDSSTTTRHNEEVSIGPSVVYSTAPDGYTNIRSTNSTNGEIIGELYNGGDPATYLGKVGNWYEVYYQGIIGYVHKSQVTLE